MAASMQAFYERDHGSAQRNPRRAPARSRAADGGTSTVSPSVRAPTTGSRTARLLPRASSAEGRLGFWRWTSIVSASPAPIARTTSSTSSTRLPTAAAPSPAACRSRRTSRFEGRAPRRAHPGSPRFSTTHHASVRSITDSISGSECPGAIRNRSPCARTASLGQSRPQLEGAVRVRALAEELVEVRVATVHLCDCAHAFVHLAEEPRCARALPGDPQPAG